MTLGLKGDRSMARHNSVPSLGSKVVEFKFGRPNYAVRTHHVIPGFVHALVLHYISYRSTLSRGVGLDRHSLLHSLRILRHPPISTRQHLFPSRDWLLEHRVENLTKLLVVEAYMCVVAINLVHGPQPVSRSSTFEECAEFQLHKPAPYVQTLLLLAESGSRLAGLLPALSAKK